MIVWIIRDNDPEGGFLSMDTNPPVISDLPSRVQEIREIEMPDEVVAMGLAGHWPPDADGTKDSNDEVLEPWYNDALVVWRRERDGEARVRG